MKTLCKFGSELRPGMLCRFQTRAATAKTTARYSDWFILIELLHSQRDRPNHHTDIWHVFWLEPQYKSMHGIVLDHVYQIAV